MMKSLLLASASALLLTVTAQNSHATILVHSTFEDSESGAVGRTTIVATNDSNLTPWYVSSGTPPALSPRLSVIDDATTGGLDKSMSLDRTYYTLTSFDQITLAVGETLSLTLNYRFVIAPGAGAEILRIAFYNTGDADAPSADSSSWTGAAEYSGYVSGIAAGTAPASGSNNTTIRKRATGTSGTLGSAVGSLKESTKDAVDSGTTAHTLIFNVTRGESSNFITLQIDGTTYVSYTDETAPYHIFNALMIGNQSGTTGASLYLDNLKVEVIPEGQTVALTLLGASVLFAGIRGRTLLSSKSAH